MEMFYNYFRDLKRRGSEHERLCLRFLVQTGSEQSATCQDLETLTDAQFF